MRLLFVVVLALLLASCAGPYAGGKLTQGASMGDVEAAMGKPKETLVDSAGYTVWFYPTAPNGRDTYAARFMPDGRLLNVDQRLTKENFEKVQPGVTTQKQIQEQFGPPMKTWRMPFMPMSEWDYLVKVDNRFFDWFVRFSDDGIVRQAFLLHDPIYDTGNKN